MYSALIIDDETDARKVLRGLLELFCPEVSSITEAKDGKECLELGKQQQFDIAFVDIELRSESGLDLAQQLIRFCKNLVFVTAHEKYAVAAYQTSAVHYLLKPVIPEQLQEAVGRIKLTDRAFDKSNRLLLPTRTGVIILEQHEIIRLEGEGNYCHFYCTDNQQYFLSRNLSYYEGLIDNQSFYRVHQSHLVNLKFVRQLSTEDGYFAQLKNGDKVPVAQRRKEGFLAALVNELGG
ncbi:MAG: LytTR family DNA-binding domain-containing protein [Bacteroidota bacterium]